MSAKILPDFCVPGKISVIIDGQFGRTGKGLVASRIAFDNHYDIAIASLSPNAGHTFYDADLNKYVTKLLPVAGILDKRCQIYISADAVIGPDILFKEFVNYYKKDFEKFKIKFPKHLRKPTHMGYGPYPWDIADHNEDSLTGILKN